MEGKNNKYQVLLVGILIVSLLLVISMTWYFTSQSAQASSTMSMSIVNSIKNTVAENFDVNHSDYFWRITLDELVRKGAHLTEYFLLGFIICMLLNVLFRRVWLAVAISLVVCPIYAYIDEYRQNFSPERGPTWFDWKLDVTGAVLGIIMATIIFLIIRYIHKLKARISELEMIKGDHHD